MLKQLAIHPPQPFSLH